MLQKSEVFLSSQEQWFDSYFWQVTRCLSHGIILPSLPGETPRPAHEKMMGTMARGGELVIRCDRKCSVG